MNGIHFLNFYVQIMRMIFKNFILLIFIFIYSIFFANYLNADEIFSWDELVRKGNKYLKKSDNKPFSGILKNFYDSGKISLKGDFLNGYQHGEFKTFHENGAISLQGQFKLGKQNGLWTEFHENGSIHWKLKYLEGQKEDGLFLMFHENGQMKSKVTYKDNVPSSNWIYYNKDGEKERIDIYENGKFFYEKHLN